MKQLKILYEDNHIIVVEKPPNIPSQGDKTGDEDMLTMIKKYLKEKLYKEKYFSTMGRPKYNSYNIKDEFIKNDKSRWGC